MANKGNFLYLGQPLNDDNQDIGGNPLKKVYKLLLPFCILNALDYITTMLAISHGAVEGNPIADYFVGNNALHFYKLVGVGIGCIYLIHMTKRNLKSAIRVLWATNLVFGLICIYNVVAYFIQKYDFALG